MTFSLLTVLAPRFAEEKIAQSKQTEIPAQTED